jgi:hypothetical protein
LHAHRQGKPSPTGWAPTKRHVHERWTAHAKENGPEFRPTRWRPLNMQILLLRRSPPCGRLHAHRQGKPSPTGWAPTKRHVHERWTAHAKENGPEFRHARWHPLNMQILLLRRSPPCGRLHAHRQGKPSPTGWAPTKRHVYERWSTHVKENGSQRSRFFKCQSASDANVFRPP